MQINITIPEDLEPFADDLHFFVTMMLKKLNINRHKGYGKVPFIELYNGLSIEVDELRDALKEQEQFDVILEASDVANFAFLMAIRASQLSKIAYREERRGALWHTFPGDPGTT